MEDTAYRAIAIVGVGAVLPDAPNAPAFWENIKSGRYSVTEVTPDRWDSAYYYDPDPSVPDKSYSKIGGWVREYAWEPMKWKLPIPPRVAAAMDGSQQWAIACTREALEDYGYPKRPLDLDRTAVILGNAMGGEKHYLTALRAYFPEYEHELEQSSSFAALPEQMRRDITRELHLRIGKHFPEITEDSMPGELANCIAGRLANIFNFHGPNYIVDAACASAMAAISSAVEGLVEKDFDVAITGGIDRNMGASTFIKFCKIGALSATGTRPFAEGADGFVMGEGSALFILKRLADAERDQDKIYAVLRGMGGASDGKGKGITAPNPVGQKFAIERAWKNAGLSPATVTLMEGHGTSTKVGDVVEAESMFAVLNEFHLPAKSIALGSVKSNFGHLKAAAGAAGLLKTIFALRDKVLPPSVHCQKTNPDIDFEHSPLFVNTTLKPWEVTGDTPRRAGLSAFGFGGTNFHAVIEEYIPHRLNGNGKKSVVVSEVPVTVGGNGGGSKPTASVSGNATSYKAPLRGALVIGAETAAALAEKLQTVQAAAQAGNAPAPAAPLEADLRAPERIAIDYADATELADKSAKALKALAANQPAIWKALRPQGIFRGHGPAPKVAFLYTGQGSQYVNMLEKLRAAEPIVAEAFRQADRVMTPLLGKPLSEFIFVDQTNANAVAKADEDLRQTEITQPAVLAIDLAMTRLLAAYGISPDFAMGHSLGEYGALVAAGAIPFDEALEAVSARGRGMARVAVEDKGRMAAVFAPIEEIERILKTIDGYVVIANVNSEHQGVVGGASSAVGKAIEMFQKAGYEVADLPVSHAFHTSIVAPASEPLRQILMHMHLEAPHLPVVANVNGEFYPAGPDVVPQMVGILAQQVAAPVQFVKGLHTLYEAGARVFVEVGPKKALQGFADDVLGGHGDVVSLFTNHPKFGDIPSFGQALCGLYAAGLGRGRTEVQSEIATKPAAETTSQAAGNAKSAPLAVVVQDSSKASSAPINGDRYAELGHLFADVLERGWQIYHGQNVPGGEPVVITGAALGLPGTEHIFDDANVGRILNGDQFIDLIPPKFRQRMLDKHITRLLKSDNGGPTFESINNVADVIKLAARGRTFDLQKEYGIAADRIAALDRVTQLAIAAGVDALRDAGIPLVMHYKTTSKGTQLPERWMLPEAMRDNTGVIFGSAFPGYDSFADEMGRYYEDRARREQLAMLESMRNRVAEANGSSILLQEINRRIDEVRATLEKDPYVFDRRFLFKTLSMGHSQFAEYIGARGPNTQLNSACATTAQAVALAEDWIGAGRCRRVIVITADDVTSDHMLEWIGAGFLASGAAATDEVVEDAAIPFDRRRHGLIIGMGAAALIVESAEAARERGIQPICEVLSTVTANSAFHGSRLDVQHIGQVMESLMSQAEARSGISRHQIAPHTVFVSHETYTPARGGSASAEIHALRQTFGDAADQIVIANTKGYTGHAMATGIEEVVAIKSLETGLIPPVANFKEVDPELGALNLSKGGKYPVEYALRLAAGFGSQISMTLLRWVPTKDGVRREPSALGYEYRIVDRPAWNNWLSRMAGYPTTELEVVNRTLRVHDQGLAARKTETPARETKPAVLTMPVSQSTSAAVAIPITMTAVAAKIDPATAPAAKVAAVLIPASQAVAIPAAPKKPPQVAIAAVPVVVPKPIPAEDSISVKDRVLTLVAEKTGYPIDMLDLDLDLEADLGVDTVKQAEIFATIREAYGIPRDETVKLRDFPTLNHVIRFANERRPKKTTQPPTLIAEAKPAAKATVPVITEAPKGAEQAHAANPANVETRESVKECLLALVVEKTGYPKDMLDLDLDLEADLGVDTVKQAEMFAAIREIYNIPRDENRKLRDYPTLAHVIRFVYEKRPDLVSQTTTPVAPQTVTEPIKPAIATEAVPAETKEETIVTAAIVTDAADSVKERLLALVVEKTGYPKDMLDLDLDLEADLGVDTVKQAEMFAAIREIYNIPRDENRKLRDYPTLAHVIRFVYEKRPDLVNGTETAAKPASESVASPSFAVPPATDRRDVARAPAPTSETADGVKERLLALVVEKTGYPKDMLDLDLDLEADLGVDTVKQAEMFAAIREIYNIPRDENRKLRDYPTLAHVIRFVYEKRPDLASGTTAAPAERIAAVVEPVALAEAAAVVATVPAIETATEDAIRDKVLEIVAEKTGYPKDMLDLDLDLEADLGVDTVKQAEMFAAVRAAYNIPRDENIKLRDFPTLASVIKFAVERQPKAAKPAASISRSTAKTEPARHEPAAQMASETKKSILPRPPLASFDAAERIPRRVPVAVLRPALEIFKPTGVKLAVGQRVVVMSDKDGVSEALAQRLKKAGVEVLSIEGAPNVESLTGLLKGWLVAGPIHGVYWLPALDDEGPISKMDFTAWHEALRTRIKSFYTTMRTLYQEIGATGTFLVSATRLGGQHGYDQAGAVSPLGGAVVGFTKTYKRERTEALVKAVDFEPGRSASEIAETLVQETLHDPGAVEIGYKQGLRWTVGLQELPVSDGQPGMTLGADSVFVITGAAGSIVSAITSDMAAASGGTFYLLDLVPEPDANNPDLKRFVADKDGLKRDLFARIQARGERATPALVEKELAALERAKAAQDAIDAVRAAGGTAYYFSVNLTDAAAVANVIKAVRDGSGHIDVLLHAAGIERSHFLPDKDQREFDLIFDVKADGFFNLLHAIGDMPLAATVAFSSIAGRFGNAGQTDYSSANDLLCKITSSFRTMRPTTRGIAIDWTAWGGIGMATRGSIPKMMEVAGIDMLPPEAGVPWIRRELTTGGTRGEVVVGQRLGMLLKEWDETGGLDESALRAVGEKFLSPRKPMVAKIVSMGLYSGLTVEATLDPAIQPFLFDHKIDGTPVLPGVMGVEAFAEAASVLLPGWHVAAMEKVNFLAPFKFYRGEPRTVKVQAEISSLGDDLVANCRLTGSRKLPNQTEPQVTVHFTARVHLSKQVPEARKAAALGAPVGAAVEASDIYRLYFHGPAYQVIERAWWDGHRVVGLLPRTLPNNHVPPELPTGMSPRLIELCFQTAGLWEMGVQGRMGLPWQIDQVCVYRDPKLAEGRLYAVVTPDAAKASFDAEVVDAAGNRFVTLKGYRTVALPNAVEAAPLKVLQAAMSGEILVAAD